MFYVQDINILSAIDDISILLDDHILKCITMRGSIYLQYIEKRFKVNHTTKTMKMKNQLHEKQQHMIKALWLGMILSIFVERWW